MRFRFIEDHWDGFPVTRMCRVLAVSSSGYYAWRHRPPSAREMVNRELCNKIEAVYNDNHGVYGSPRIYRELKDQGVACSENRIARLMRLRGLQAKQSRRFKTTTKRNKAHPAAPNLLKRDFTADRPDQKWLADITYIATLEGWLYLAAILDLYTRRIVGWAMSDRMTSDLTMAALEMALLQRQPHAGLIHHSDQGSQYTDQAYQALLKDHGIRASMNGAGRASGCITICTIPATRRRPTCSTISSRSTTDVADTRRWTISARRPMSRSSIKECWPLLNSMSTKPGEGR
jgi:putative transposase